MVTAMKAASMGSAPGSSIRRGADPARGLAYHPTADAAPAFVIRRGSGKREQEGD